MPSAVKTATATLNSVVPVLLVTDLDQSIAHYRAQLGFEFDFKHREYAAVSRNNCAVHLCVAKNAAPRSNRSSWGGGLEPADVMFFVDDVDALHRELVGRGAMIDRAPADHSYGIRDFTVRDCDGYSIRFNQVIGE